MVNCTGENCPFKGTTKEEAAVCDNSSYCICVSPPKKAVYKTNAAKIRMMTDEELAKWFCDKVSCGCECLALCKDCGRDDKSCTQAWLNWLKQ